MRILLLEDEPAIRQAVARGLQRWGHEVFVASDVAQARQVLADESPEAIVSDCKLPDGSGLQFAVDSGVPFILMSGMAQFDDAVKAMRAGCVDFLTKPVKFDTLRTALDRLMTQREQAVIESIIALPRASLEQHHGNEEPQQEQIKVDI